MSRLKQVLNIPCLSNGAQRLAVECHTAAYFTAHKVVFQCCQQLAYFRSACIFSRRSVQAAKYVVREARLESALYHSADTPLCIIMIGGGSLVVSDAVNCFFTAELTPQQATGILGADDVTAVITPKVFF